MIDKKYRESQLYMELSFSALSWSASQCIQYCEDLVSSQQLYFLLQMTKDLIGLRERLIVIVGL